MTTVESRVAHIAEAVLAERQFVTPIDVLVGLGWLKPQGVDYWLRGTTPFLGRLIHKSPDQITGVLDELSVWAHECDLRSWETDYGDRTFTEDADPATERAFRTRWAAAEQPAPRIPRVRPRERKVMAAESSWECVECGVSEDLLLKAKSGGICLDCAGLGHLVFLPAGDAALTRRTKKASRNSAVVVRFNRTRYRTERQGILAENQAIELAAQQCLEDADGPTESVREDFATAIRKQFPGCPPGRVDAIAYHGALGVKGRRAADWEIGPEAVQLAVTSSVRHVDTEYDHLLMSGVKPGDARDQVAVRVQAILAQWHAGVVVLD
ncbi:DUF2293 domain-containing protein [Mycolicibacterium mengxianglii]|uniref:DUF2293 domain-containing protein n=1 Tax=Mycolicibacterium mengxianglii TaxID=2736649 RepID=UPI0018D12B44|nr:DUF2293 domain-containing protein [Mycolicibacterium mengxianglii]